MAVHDELFGRFEIHLSASLACNLIRMDLSFTDGALVDRAGRMAVGVELSEPIRDACC